MACAVGCCFFCGVAGVANEDPAARTRTKSNKCTWRMKFALTAAFYFEERAGTVFLQLPPWSLDGILALAEAEVYCWGAKYPLRARTCRSFFNAVISIARYRPSASKSAG